MVLNRHSGTNHHSRSIQNQEANMSESASKFYALLIGIDYYQPNPFYRSLKGAVRDITLVEQFLKTTLKVPAEQIITLLSSPAEDLDLMSVRSTQPPEPTYDNIVAAFHQITESAQANDQVYIHYSGHGGRAKTVYPNLKQGRLEQYDEGIVPMDVGKAGHYLRDVEMATLLKRLTDKGCILTVILDSCHSGGATRGDVEIRGGTSPDRTDRSPDSQVAPREELERNWLELTRDRTISAAGLPQAREYVLLTACRPNEYAYEYAVNGGGERNGALTYWMIDTLTSAATSGQRLTYKLLHDRIQAQVQSKFVQQVPMILGESDRLVFGNERWSTPFTISVIKVISATQIRLNAGQAQGLSKGTRFSIYPLNTTDFTDPTRQVAIAEIAQIEASESTANILTPEAGGIVVSRPIEPGSPAIMLSAPVGLVQRVRFFGEKVVGDQDHELPPQFVDKQQAALDRVRQTLTGNGWITEVKAGESALFQVAIDRDGNYEICQNGSPIEYLYPLLSMDDPTAPQRVSDRLTHLAKYQAVQSIDNSSSKLAAMISMEIVKEDGTAFDDPQNPLVQDGEIILLRLTNQGNQSLKVALLNIQPNWAISQIPVTGIDSPFFNLEAGAQEEVMLSMSMPENAHRPTQDTFKVFAVQRGLADFRWLILPPLDEPAEPKAAQLEREETSQVTRGGVTRSMTQPEGMNPLNNLLKMIGADIAQSPNVTRSGTIVVNPKQEWMTKQMTVTVTRSI
jgi:hypothetical protein